MCSVMVCDNFRFQSLMVGDELTISSNQKPVIKFRNLRTQWVSRWSEDHCSGKDLTIYRIAQPIAKHYRHYGTGL